MILFQIVFLRNWFGVPKQHIDIQQLQHFKNAEKQNKNEEKGGRSISSINICESNHVSIDFLLGILGVS